MKAHFASLLIATFLQFATSQTIDDLPAEYKPLIEERQRTLGITLRLSGLQIGQTHGVIGTNIDIAYSNITNEIDELDDLADSAEAAAEAADKDIDECIQTMSLSVSALNPREIKACRIIPQLGQAKLKLQELGSFQGELRNALPTCSVSNALDTAQIRSCIDAELSRIDNGITATSNDLTSLLDASVTAGNDCVDTRKTALENQLSVIKNDFTKCIGA